MPFGGVRTGISAPQMAAKFINDDKHLTCPAIKASSQTSSNP
jgi:hypothetical protein